MYAGLVHQISLNRCGWHFKAWCHVPALNKRPVRLSTRDTVHTLHIYLCYGILTSLNSNFPYDIVNQCMSTTRLLSSPVNYWYLFLRLWQDIASPYQTFPAIKGRNNAFKPPSRILYILSQRTSLKSAVPSSHARSSWLFNNLYIFYSTFSEISAYLHYSFSAFQFTLSLLKKCIGKLH